MKRIIIGLVIFLLGLIVPSLAQSASDNSCQIKLFVADRDNYD